MKHGEWRKSTRSGNVNDTCVELRDQGPTVGVRDSKDPNGPHLSFGNEQMASLLNKIKRGGYEL